jgi:hypothetical protein
MASTTAAAIKFSRAAAATNIATPRAATTGRFRRCVYA